jgi:hypothetical protein
MTMTHISIIMSAIDKHSFSERNKFDNSPISKPVQAL